MAQTSIMLYPNPNQKHRLENFDEFYEKWLVQQKRDLIELATVTRAYDATKQKAELDLTVQELADRVMSHYEHYYRVKVESTPGFVNQMLNPTWCSTANEAYMWIGGWRPTMLFELLRSEASTRVEPDLGRVLTGITTNVLDKISDGQVRTVNQVQIQTITVENKMTKKWAACQENVTAGSTTAAHSTAVSDYHRPEIMDRQSPAVLKSKEVEFEAVLKEADELRLRTLKRFVAILTPVQTIRFLISVAQLHLELRGWAKKKYRPQIIPTTAGPSS